MPEPRSAVPRVVGWIGPVLCVTGAVCMFAALAVSLDSTAAKVLMAAAAALFVPGALLTLAVQRYVVGPPQ